MKKFLVLYKASPELFKQWMSMPPEEQKRGMDIWKKWMADHAKDMADGGGPVSKVKRVTKDGVSDAHNDIGAYSIVQANSHEEAAAIFKDSPHFDGADSSAVIDVMAMPEWPKQ